MTSSELIWQAIDEHILLLEQMGYNLDLKNDVIYFNEEIPIIKKDKQVGVLILEEKNMYFLHEKNKIVGNRDLSQINFSRRKSKNMRTLFHTRLTDNNLIINNYNMLLSDERRYISYTDKKNFVAIKMLDSTEVIVNSLVEDISDKSILNYLKEPRKNGKLTYRINEVNKNEHKN